MPRGGEIARVDRGLDITRGYIDGDWWLPPQDSVLTEKGGGDYLLYDDLLRDDRIASALQQRRGAVLGRPVEVIPGGQSAQDKAAADHLREVLGLGEEQEPGIVDWHSVVDQMLFGPFYGFSVAEAIWQRDGRHWVPELRVRNRRRFAWKVRGKGPVARWKLILRTVQHGNGIEVPEKKFWTMICGSDNSDEPYGRGLAHALYWPTWFKRNQIGFWLVALEKFGSPTAVGKHLPNASEDDKSKLLEAVKAVHTDSGVVIPEGQLIELLESSGRGTIDFEAFNRAMDRAITTVILSETMTTDDGSSLAQAKVHSEVKREIVAADARLVSETFRRSIATWMTEWNYAGARAPIVRWPMDDPPDQNKLAERDALIVGKLGFKLKKEYVEETYGVELEEPEPEPAPEPGGRPPTEDGDDGVDMASSWQHRLLSRAKRRAASLASENRNLDDVEKIMAAIDDDAWDEIAAPIIEPILRRAQEAPEAFLSDLAQVYPQMDVDELARRLARVLFVASVWGRLQIEGTDEG